MPTALHTPESRTHTVANPASSVSASTFRGAFIAPRFGHDPDWPWVTKIGPLAQCPFTRCTIDNTFTPLPRATRLYRAWQHGRAVRSVRDAEVVFLFSADIVRAVARRVRPARVYVGFTQDGPWPAQRVERLGRAMRHCDVVCTFTEEERQIYLARYGLEPERLIVVPLHTDETLAYRQYPDIPPISQPYVLALGSPNRRFEPTARLCLDRGIPLVIITRPWHQGDDLDVLRGLGARVITDAGKLEALTWLKHARLAVMPFMDPEISGGYTTLVHAMFLRTPFVATRCVGIPEHVVDGENGFVTPHGDESALGDAIERLWSEEGLAERFGEASWTRAHERHSLEAAARHYHTIGCRLAEAVRLSR